MAVWRKSSFSAGDENCVEIAWRKSSYSGGMDENCVEVTLNTAGFAVRDSKNPEATLKFEQSLARALRRLPRR